MKLIASHRVVCIQGEPGCGKSTRIPQFILDYGRQNIPPRILVTQPRRLAAMRVAERVASERKEELGQTVGFCIGGEKHRSRDTSITYCTTGYLLQVCTVILSVSLKVMMNKLEALQLAAAAFISMQLIFIAEVHAFN